VSPARSRPAGAGLWHSIKPNSIGFANAAGDLAGGVTAAIVALPLALAFGVASGAGPVAGIYGAICVGLFAALFGGTPTQISGPTGPMTIVSASLFTQFGDEPAIAFTVVMLTGLLQIGFGALRIGRYVNLMPYPVISGFMTGIGGILLLMQIEPLLGRSATAGGAAINGSALLIGAVAMRSASSRRGASGACCPHRCWHSPRARCCRCCFSTCRCSARFPRPCRRRYCRSLTSSASGT
jgi:hypothetical protein